MKINEIGVTEASGLRGSIRLVKLVWLLFVRHFLEPYGPKMLKICRKTSKIYSNHPGGRGYICSEGMLTHLFFPVRKFGLGSGQIQMLVV